MELNLKKPIIFFDLETTGTNITTDRIVEISMIKIMPNGEEKERTLRINPEMPIPAEATAVHHITDEDVANCRTFKEIAKDLAQSFVGCDIAGFNSNRFDIPMLDQEFQRVGVKFDFTKPRFIDVQTIFHKKEQRTLVAAYKFYCHKDLENAHSAEADTLATYEILKAQLDKYPETLKNDVAMLAEFSTRTRFVDYAGRIVLNDKDQPVINFGKHKGKLVEEVLLKEPSYYSWMMNGEFPLFTKKVITAIRLRMRN